MSAPTLNFRLAATVVASCNFMGTLDSTIITVAMPHMARSFGVRPVELTIGITAYIATMAIILPASAWIAGRFGARRVLIASIGGFTLASVACGLSAALPGFVAARIVQAACAALMAPVGNQILFQITPRREFVTAVAISTTPGLIAPVIGPPLGGLIITALDWPWIFFLNVPIGVVGIALTLRSMPRIDRGDPRPFDWRGFALTGTGLAGLIYGLERASIDPRDPAALLPIAAGLLLGALAIRHMRRAEHPILSLAPLGTPTFVASTLTGGALVRIAFRSTNIILPLMMQGALGLNAFWAGLLLLGYNGGDLALKAVAGRILRRYGFRRCMTVSALLTAAATAGLALLSANTPWLAMLAAVTLCGALRSVLFTCVASVALADIPAEDMPQASVLSNVANQTIGAFAVSLAGLILAGSAALRGGGEALVLADYRAALLIMVLPWAAAGLAFRRLPHHAGAEVSGHSPAPVTLPRSADEPGR